MRESIDIFSPDVSWLNDGSDPNDLSSSLVRNDNVTRAELHKFPQFASFLRRVRDAAPILRTVKAAQNFELGDCIHTGEVEQAEVAATVYVIGAVNGPVVL